MVDSSSSSLGLTLSLFTTTIRSTYGGLKKAWIGYNIVKREDDYDKMLYYSEGVKGNEPARNCEIGLRILQITNGCIWLSDDDKSLVWDNGNTLTSIRANGGKAIFHLAFSQKSFAPNQEESIGEAYCGVLEAKVRVKSWIGSQEALVSSKNFNIKVGDT
jgi:hypothetical protein